MRAQDIVLGLIILAAIFRTLKYMGKTRGCGGNCYIQDALYPQGIGCQTAAHGCVGLPSASECLHPCRSRSGKVK